MEFHVKNTRKANCPLPGIYPVTITLFLNHSNLQRNSFVAERMKNRCSNCKNIHNNHRCTPLNLLLIKLHSKQHYLKVYPQILRVHVWVHFSTHKKQQKWKSFAMMSTSKNPTNPRTRKNSKDHHTHFLSQAKARRQRRGLPRSYCQPRLLLGLDQVTGLSSTIYSRNFGGYGCSTCR